jgi:hypothetical protein
VKCKNCKSERSAFVNGKTPDICQVVVGEAESYGSEPSSKKPSAKRRSAKSRKGHRGVAKKKFDFVKAVEVHLLSLGATIFGDAKNHEWKLLTKAGRLWLRVDETNVFARFDDVQEALKASAIASSFNPYSGKWNFHPPTICRGGKYRLSDAEGSLEEFKARMARVALFDAKTPFDIEARRKLIDAFGLLAESAMKGATDSSSEYHFYSVFFDVCQKYESLAKALAGLHPKPAD